MRAHTVSVTIYKYKNIHHHDARAIIGKYTTRN